MTRSIDPIIVARRFCLITTGSLSVEDRERLGWLVDSFGMKSAKAQGLRSAITSLVKLQQTDQILYMAAQRTEGDRYAHALVSAATVQFIFTK